jgi:hypothetical protein
VSLPTAYNGPESKLVMAANPHTPPQQHRPVPTERPVRRAKTSDPGERRELIRRATTRVRTKASIDFLRDVRGR